MDASAETTNRFISSIHVSNLFGLYTYHLLPKRPAPNTPDNLLILYGDNGSGKTTILKLVFHLLSPANDKGHRTFLANTPFQTLRVELGNGTTITARRRRSRLLTGSYRLILALPDERPISLLVHAPSGSGRVPVDKNPLLPRFLRRLAQLNLTLHYLSDDRKHEGDTDADEPKARQQEVSTESEWRTVLTSTPPANPEPVLEASVRRLDVWIRARALKAASEGEANTNTIYAEIVRRIGRARGAEDASEATSSTAALREALVELEQRSTAFSEFNLVSPLHVSEIIATLDRAPSPTQRIILNVLVPYVNGLKARLDALQSIQTLIRIFVEAINSFLTDKTLSFTLPDGIKIIARNGRALTLRMLSSGERQLLLLFCDTMTARDQASVFIIDEPELSLNVKWQRRLLDMLLKCAEGSSIQFITATHSVELVSRHLAHVLHLRQVEEPPIRDSQA